ncbi:MAG: hypothetical protein IPO81_19095 [Kouleothrix sp.]|nr:hypothetical protein [Kouleothrix sp.]
MTFVAPLDAVQSGPSGGGVGRFDSDRRAWLRRTILAWDTEQLVAGLPRWRGGAGADPRLGDGHAGQQRGRKLALDRRPHLAVHRCLSPGLLALLAVWHNHRVFTRGVHKGHSPLHLSGMLEAPTDWLVALGYPPASIQAISTSEPLGELALAA